MDQEMKRKYLALAILANAGDLKRAQFCAELRKITSLDHLLFVLDRITDAQLLRRGLNVFTHHKDFTLRALFVILPENHYLDHQEILGDALLRHPDFQGGRFGAFLEQAGFGAGMHLIDQLAQDPTYQPFLIYFFQEYKYSDDYSKAIAEAIVCHPLAIEQLSDLITKTDHMETKLIFAKAAAATEHLDVDVLRGFFRTIEGDAQREVAFINAAHPSAGETFFVLLTETEFEPTREACVRKLKDSAHSLATIEY